MLTVVQAVGLSFCPETPVWLEWKGKPEEGLKAKEALQGAAAQTEPTSISSQSSQAEKAELGTGNGDETDVLQPLRGLPERRHSEAESSYQVTLA